MTSMSYLGSICRLGRNSGDRGGERIDWFEKRGNGLKREKTKKMRTESGELELPAAGTR